VEWLPSELRSRLGSALSHATQTLLAARSEGGCWSGELSSSALSTATAVCALAVFEKYSTHRDPGLTSLIDQGLHWLANHVNSDGGWGDTELSLSNLSTTVLCWAAFGSVPGADQEYFDLVADAKRWLKRSTGNLDPSSFVPAVVNRYGDDRTFSVPILTMCALSGRLGADREAWRWVKPLPFELGALPHRWFGAVGLPVVSYALPALIAIGQVRHHFRPTRNPVTRLLRELTRKNTLELLISLQPANGGFLEATPLTSFVTMSLAAMGLVKHPVTLKGVEFLRQSAREDGSWPIDTNLATWVTTLSVNALAHQSVANWLRPEERTKIRDWLLGQQHLNEHPYTHAAPGGWAWTDLPGGVPDADDTAGALLALHHLGEFDDRVRRRAELAVDWLLGLQNRDGGIPTFCRGWGKLPFDRSSPDLTAHALRAWAVWLDEVSEPRRAVVKADSLDHGKCKHHVRLLNTRSDVRDLPEPLLL
jgi:squalene-hopene/tetraprenyl-beta-curcumene cyclase